MSAAEAQARPNRRGIILGVKALVSVGIVAYLLWRIDIAAILRRAGDADPLLMALAAGLVLVQFVIAALRWSAVAAALDGHLPLSASFRLVYIGQFFNLVLPSTVGGDAVRVWMIWKSGMSAMSAAASVLIDRLAAVLGLILTIAVMTPFMPQISETLMLRLAVAGLVAAALAGTALSMCLDRIPVRFRVHKAVAALAELAVDIRRVLLVPRHAVPSVGCGVLGQVNLSFALYVLALALGVPVSAVDCLVLWPLVVLVTLLPLSISGWGLREGAMVVALGLVGVPEDQSLLLSLVIGVLGSVMALPGGLVFLAVDSAAKAEAQAPEQP